MFWLIVLCYSYLKSSVLKTKEGETVYDYCWYPYMSSMDPDTCW